MPIVYTEVDVDLEDFSTEDILEELEQRDVAFVGNNKLLIQNIYDAQQLGKNIQSLLDQLFWNTIGRIN